MGIFAAAYGVLTFVISYPLAFCLVVDIGKRAKMNRGLFALILCIIGSYFYIFTLALLLPIYIIIPIILRKDAFAAENEERTANNITWLIVKLEKIAFYVALVFSIYCCNYD